MSLDEMSSIVTVGLTALWGGGLSAYLWWSRLREMHIPSDLHRAGIRILNDTIIVYI